MGLRVICVRDEVENLGKARVLYPRETHCACCFRAKNKPAAISSVPDSPAPSQSSIRNGLGGGKSQCPQEHPDLQSECCKHHDVQCYTSRTRTAADYSSKHAGWRRPLNTINVVISIRWIEQALSVFDGSSWQQDSQNRASFFEQISRFFGGVTVHAFCR